MADLPDPVRARCDCGETWVFLGYPTRPCGRCRQRVIIVREVEDELEG